MSPSIKKKHSIYTRLAIDPSTQLGQLSGSSSTPNLTPSPTARYVTHARSLSIVPKALIASVVESVESVGKVALSNRDLGDDMAKALSHAFKNLIVLDVDVSCNHLTDSGVTAVLSCLDPHFLQRLDLSSIRLKKRSVSSLSDLLLETSTLTALKAADCTLDDTSLRALSLSLLTSLCPFSGAPLHNCTLTVLNLHGNKIGDAGASALAAALRTNGALAELDLSCNSIRARGGADLFRALNFTAVAVLDLARNGMSEKEARGSGPGGSSAARAIAECLEDNSSLVHLSLAHCGLTGEQCGTIGEGMRGNRTLLGVHMEGNARNVDARGFVEGGEREGGGRGEGGEEEGGERTLTEERVRHSHERIVGEGGGREGGGEGGGQWQKRGGMCWICHGWNETR